ncbi:hypothetical protein GGR51DRAFT_577120 [Nemania sp. FL0031]|nr:hypothetical protein GGR51DRAFT_577120 [Nemania sp. FL0031]
MTFPFHFAIPGIWPTQAPWLYTANFGAPAQNHPMASYFPQDMLYELWRSYNTPPEPPTAPAPPPAVPAPNGENTMPSAGANQDDGPPEIPPTNTPPPAMPPVMAHYSVVHTVQYSPWSPTLGDERAESVVIGTCGTLYEANELAMKEVYEKYGNLAHIGRAAWDPPSPTWLRKAGTGRWPNTWKIEEVYSQYPLMVLDQQDENRSRYASNYYPIASGHRHIVNPLPYYCTSMMEGTLMPTLSPKDRAPPPDGLPVFPPSPLSYRLAGQQQNYLSPPPAALSAAPHVSIKKAKISPHPAQILGRKYLDRLSRLEDEVYPLKLVRELARISDTASFPRNEESVFGVIHVNISLARNLTIENIGTYTTAKAANDRVLDFWDQKYGTGTTTSTPGSAEADTMIMRFEHIEESDNRPTHVSRCQKPNYPSSSGVLEDSSYWVITNNCLSLNNKSDEEERKVYVVTSHLRDQGIHGC